MTTATLGIGDVLAPRQRRRASASAQVLTLSGRSIMASFREGDFIFAFCGPMIFYICLYVPLHYTLNTHNSLDYAQFLLPAIAVQGMFFTAMSAADLAAADSSSNMRDRLRAMPLWRWSPLLGRLVCHGAGCALVICGSTAIGYLFGFRFATSVGDFILYVALLMFFGIALGAGADAIGSWSGNPEIGGQLLLIPQLLLIMISTGISPAENFPDWIEPVVRNQPISPIVEALRDLASGSGYTHLPAALIWCVGMALVFGVLAIYGEARKR